MSGRTVAVWEYDSHNSHNSHSRVTREGGGGDGGRESVWKQDRDVGEGKVKREESEEKVSKAGRGLHVSRRDTGRPREEQKMHVVPTE